MPRIRENASDGLELDPAICWQAIYSRDRRFDGRFFAGVLTTGVYCRPICPIPLRKPDNVRWYRSAASAEAAGFRPCRRCRSHTSPGTPAWLGTSAVVSRALRLIAEGFLDNGDVEEFAEHMGLGSRHLRRLFVQHLGAAPIKIAGTRRVHFARNLLEQTALPVSEIASYSGFKSVRQFNHAMRSAFAVTPSQIRRPGSGAKAPALRQSGVTLQLSYRPPYDWQSILRFLKARATPGVEAVEEDCYRRTIEVSGQLGVIEVRADPDEPLLRVQVNLPDYQQLMPIVERVRQIFDLGADPLQIMDHLQKDARLAPLIAARPGLRVPGAWDAFELAVRAVLGQQLTFVDPKSLVTRLVKAFGRRLKTPHATLTHLFPRPEIIAEANLSAIAIPIARAAAIRAVARAACNGALSQLRSATSDGLLAGLCSISGIEARQANYIALRAFGDPDAFPADKGLRRSMGPGLQPITENELIDVAGQWRPWRGYAAMHLWANRAAL